MGRSTKICSYNGCGSIVRSNAAQIVANGVRYRLCSQCASEFRDFAAEKLTGDPVKTSSVKCLTPSLVTVDSGQFIRSDNSVITVSAFSIGKYVVTQQLYYDVVGENPSIFIGNNKRPVENVSWFDAVEFCNMLSRREWLTEVYMTSNKNITWNPSANGYRLPTEAEWEYAARGGNQSKGYAYSGSDNVDEVGWYNDNSESKTHPVGEKKANELGLYDMSGNVWEWCWDWYADYPVGSVTDPTGPTGGLLRVLRGGGWSNVAGNCRSAIHSFNSPGNRNYYLDLGFRLAKSL